MDADGPSALRRSPVVDPEGSARLLLGLFPLRQKPLDIDVARHAILKLRQDSEAGQLLILNSLPKLTHFAADEIIRGVTHCRITERSAIVPTPHEPVWYTPETLKNHLNPETSYLSVVTEVVLQSGPTRSSEGLKPRVTKGSSTLMEWPPLFTLLNCLRTFNTQHVSTTCTHSIQLRSLQSLKFGGSDSETMHDGERILRARKAPRIYPNRAVTKVTGASR